MNFHHLACAFALAVIASPSSGQAVSYEVIAVEGQQAIGKPPGTNYRFFSRPFIDEAGRVVFENSFTDGTVFVYRVPSGEPPVIISTGMMPVGMGDNASIGDTMYAEQIAADGDLLAYARVDFDDGIPVPTLYGYGTYTDAESGFRFAPLAGTTAPGVGPGALFCSLTGYWVEKHLSTAGHFALYSTLCGPNGGGAGIWVTDEDGRNLQLVVSGSQLSPDIPNVRIQGVGLPVVNSQGTVVFRGYYNGPGITADNSKAFFAWNQSTGITTVVREGDPVPGFPPTITFTDFIDARINDLGHTLIWGKIQGPGITDDSDQILISDRGGNGFEHVYREGIQAPGLTPGVKIANIGNVYFNNKSQIGFFSGVDGPTMPHEDETYFWSEGGPPGLTKVAHTGQHVPGYSTKYTLDKFYYTQAGSSPDGPDPVFTDSGRLVFHGQLDDGLSSPGNYPRVHFISDAVNELRLLAPAGAQLDVSDDPNNPDLRIIESSAFRLRGSTNEAEQVAMRVKFTDDTFAIVVASYVDGCLADVNGDGQATPTDFTAWLSAFNANAPECDQNGDGQCTPTDFSAWISNYTIGC